MKEYFSREVDYKRFLFIKRIANEIKGFLKANGFTYSYVA